MKKNYSSLKCIALLLIFSQNVAEARQASIILAEATGSTSICGGEKECIRLRQETFNNTISFFKKELERSGELLGIFSVGFDDAGGNKTEWLKENLTECGKIDSSKHRNYIVKIGESETAVSWQTSGVAFLMSSAMSGDSLEPHPLMKYIAVELLEKCTDYTKLKNITELKVVSISDTLINSLERDVKKYITVFDTEPVGKPRGEWIFMGNKKTKINKKINNNHSVNGNEWLWKRNIYMKSKGTVTQYDTSLKFEVAQQGDYELVIYKGLSSNGINKITCNYDKLSNIVDCSIRNKYNEIFSHNGEYAVTVRLNGSHLFSSTIEAKKIKKWKISPSKLKFPLEGLLFSDNLFVDNQPLCDSSSNEDKKICHVNINLLKIIDEKNSYVYNNKALVGKIVIEKSSLNIDSISKNWGFLGLTVTGTGSFLPNSELDMIFGTNQIQCHSEKTVWECKKNWGVFDFSTDNFDLVLQDPHLRAIKKNIKISLFERILINPIGVIVLLLLTAIFVLFFRYRQAFKTPPKVINR